MSKFVVLSICAFLASFAAGRYEDRYDLSRLPIDLRPVMQYIGLWELEGQTGNTREFAPPDLIDMAINPIPKFGARAVNVTHSYFDRQKNVIRSEYGFMPVKNTTRRDPRIHVAYLTTSSEGYSMMEQGVVRGNKMTFHLKQFLRRSFDVGSNGVELEIREFERQFELLDSQHMILKIRAETSLGAEGFTANYRKILP